MKKISRRSFLAAAGVSAAALAPRAPQPLPLLPLLLPPPPPAMLQLLLPTRR